MVRIQFGQPLSLEILAKLGKLGVFSHHGGPLQVLGRNEGVFFLGAANLPKLLRSPLAVKVNPLTNFRLAGLYRIHFKVVEQGFQGKVSFRISSPREGFGKKLIYLEEQVLPALNLTRQIDSAGNRWINVSLHVKEKTRHLKLNFYFIYHVDVAQILEHSLSMVPLNEPIGPVVNSQALQMLKPSPKIDSASPRIRLMAKSLFGEGRHLSAHAKYRRVQSFVKNYLPYDHQKRARFFGGKMVYKSMAQMYNHPETTLDRGQAACPSVSILEASLLRASGVPARTAGRWGHFYTELYIPGRGWLSSSVTPTGIPLVRDVDYRHQPLVSWEPEIAVQTTMWGGNVKVLE
jgi:hypothetical protein